MKPTRPIAEEEAESHYTPTPTICEFHACDDPVRGIIGPLGSGKSTGCVTEIYDRALAQTPYKGVRRFRAIAIRETYPELISTTMKTWKEWIPESICPITMSVPIAGHMREKLADGTRLEFEIVFLALDQPDDVAKLKSLEATIAWINEAAEISDKAILDMLTARVGRYPPMKWGGPAWSGVIMDSNAPDTDHWWFDLAEVRRPRGYRFWRQPPAVLDISKKSADEPQQFVVNYGQDPNIERAENIENLRPNYYENMLAGKDELWIRVFLMGEYGTVQAGKPVYPEYRDQVHCAKSVIEPYRALPLIVGQDMGLTPGCVLCQLTPRGQFLALDELFANDIGIREFAQTVLKPHLRNQYRDMQIIVMGDPTGGAQRSQITSEDTCIKVLREEGFQVQAAKTNDFLTRRESVVYFLNRSPDGLPGFQLSPKCKETRQGFLKKYHYKQTRSIAGVRFSDRPEKNHPWSTLHDGLHYSCMYAQSGSVSPGGYGQMQMGERARPIVPRMSPE